MENSKNLVEGGSYHVSSFSANKDAEIRRLDAQVDLFWSSEHELITRYGLNDEMDYLDCGCGPGRLIDLLKRQFPALKCTGLEMDPILVEAAKQKVKARGHSDCHIVQGVAEDPKLPEHSFDFITMRLVLEHVPDPILALQSLGRLLRPGGRIFIISNDFENHTRTWPPVPELDPLYEAYCESRRNDNGDPCIGRRVPRLLRNAGFAVIAQEIEVAHNAISGDEAFFKAEGVGIPAQLVSSGFLQQAVFESMIKSWKEMIAHPDHCITRQLCVAIGEAQSEDASAAAIGDSAPLDAANTADLHVDAEEYSPPGTDLERHLAALWCGAMKLEKVSIRSNFFDLGGNSLMLGQLHGKMQDLLSCQVPITTLFQYPTIEMLAEHLSDEQTKLPSTETTSAEPGARSTETSLTDVRERARRRRGALGLRKFGDSD